MPNPENIEPHQFKPGETGNPNGRPPKLLGAINAELRTQGYVPVNISHVREAYEILFNLPEDKIQAIKEDKDTPMFLKIVAKEMLSKSGKFMIERMLDRAHGKAKQVSEIHVETNHGLPDASKYSFDELYKIAHGSGDENKEVG